MKRYFALVENGIVQQVIVAKESPGDGWVETWRDGSERGNYAGAGMIYDSDLDAFYWPQPYISWSLDKAFIWRAPVDMPDDGQNYSWDESVGEWVVSE